MTVCVLQGTARNTHCAKVVEETDAGGMRRLQWELQERLHVEGMWQDSWAPEEGRDRPWSVYTSWDKDGKKPEVRKDSFDLLLLVLLICCML